MDDYQYWFNLKQNESKKYYKKLANQIAKIIIEKFNLSNNDLSFLDVWTPLTYNKYFNAYYGSYGI